ncbi:RNA polymerase sigma factor [Pyxidicoccus parkwayensis]|uniref:RNA polymerase sigma factor n=1 Tax=Pyxidicoccus parkwayensis TaxID=2813578 RepID=A0ABX7NYU9_9BACT|nr:RNA polymerase sigma factor [Pyxidicoccus parkwaysis]QSQ23975.1 RNA polymerase sigma factor [Pyxidicoccus parkwaysis]
MTDSISDASKVVPFPGDSRRRLDARTDEELMLLSAAGSEEAFEQLVRRHHSRLARYCGKSVGSASEGDELAQEALVRVWQARRDYQPRAPFAVFMLTIARNLCRNRARDTGRRSRWQTEAAEGRLAAVPSQSSPDVVEQMLEREQQRRVREALMELPDTFREVLLLRFDQELDYAAIARIVGDNEATVRTRVFRGVKKLRAKVTGGRP